MVHQRHEIYRPTHKALRHMMFSTAHKLGIADFRDDAEARDAITSLERTINLLVIHAEHENNYIHPDLEKRAPGLIAPYETDHQNDEKVHAELRRLGQEANSASGDQKVALGIELYDRFNSYIGDYLGHLVREESELQQALWDNFTDEELDTMAGRLIANYPPDQRGEILAKLINSYDIDRTECQMSFLKHLSR